MKKQSQDKVAVVFGGTGFIGRNVVRALARAGMIVKVATRVPERAYFLRPCGAVGQIVPVACDPGSSDDVAAAIRGADYVVNCVGVLHERRRGDFEKIYVTLPAAIAASCAGQKVARLVHVSALGIEESRSRYAASKRRGEEILRERFPAVTILRPSVVFGADDDFFNKFAKLSAVMPALPLIGGGRTRFQPVYVGDIALAVVAALTLPGLGPVSGSSDPRGKVYELGGPAVMDFRAIYGLLAEATGRRKMLISLPWFVAKIQAVFLSMLPQPVLTPDQVESLKSDSVVDEGALTFRDLGIAPRGMDLIVPDYLEYSRPGGRFAARKRA